MAILRFSFGTMGSGKSTLALQIHHNLSSRQLFGLLVTTLDREGSQVTSRLGCRGAGDRRDPGSRSVRPGGAPLAAALSGVRRGAVLHGRAVRPAGAGGRRPGDRCLRVRAADGFPRGIFRGHTADAGDRRRTRGAAGRGRVAGVAPAPTHNARVVNGVVVTKARPWSSATPTNRTSRSSATRCATNWCAARFRAGNLGG